MPPHGVRREGTAHAELQATPAELETTIEIVFDTIEPSDVALAAAHVNVEATKIAHRAATVRLSGLKS